MTPRTQKMLMRWYDKSVAGSTASGDSSESAHKWFHRHAQDAGQAVAEFLGLSVIPWKSETPKSPTSKP